jgi:hypothetical protein
MYREFSSDAERPDGKEYFSVLADDESRQCEGLLEELSSSKKGDSVGARDHFDSDTSEVALKPLMSGESDQSGSSRYPSLSVS